jgi:hypothetical protein
MNKCFSVKPSDQGLSRGVDGVRLGNCCPSNHCTHLTTTPIIHPIPPSYPFNSYYSSNPSNPITDVRSLAMLSLPQSLQIVVEDCRSSRGPPGTRGQKNGHPDGSLYFNRLNGQNPWAILGPGLGTLLFGPEPNLASRLSLLWQTNIAGGKSEHIPVYLLHHTVALLQMFATGIGGPGM